MDLLYFLTIVLPPVVGIVAFQIGMLSTERYRLNRRKWKTHQERGTTFPA
jgi:hypothetical protein